MKVLQSFLDTLFLFFSKLSKFPRAQACPYGPTQCTTEPNQIYRIPKLRFGRIQKYRTELSDETRGPRANLSPLFTKKLLKVATWRHFLSCLSIFRLNFSKNWKIILIISIKVQNSGLPPTSNVEWSLCGH